MKLQSLLPPKDHGNCFQCVCESQINIHLFLKYRISSILPRVYCLSSDFAKFRLPELLPPTRTSAREKWPIFPGIYRFLLDAMWFLRPIPDNWTLKHQNPVNWYVRVAQ